MSFSASSAFFLALSKRESRYSPVISSSPSDSSRDDESESESESVPDEVPVVDMDLRAASSALSKSIYFVSEYDEATALANTPVALSFPLLVLSDMITVEVVEVVLVVVTFFPTCRKSRDYTKVEVIDRTVVRVGTTRGSVFLPSNASTQPIQPLSKASFHPVLCSA